MSIQSESQEINPDSQELELVERFQAERLHRLSAEFLEREGLVGKIEGKEFVVGLIKATDELSDIARSVETKVFSDRFSRSLSEVDAEYKKQDELSTFLALIDVTDRDNLKPMGALRIIESDNELGLKSINDFVADTPDNPWIDEVKQLHFTPEEGYDPIVAWNRLCQRVGVTLKPEETFDIATLAVLPEYASSGSLDGASIGLYHSCLRYSFARGIKNFMSIQDLRPLEIIQAFGEPFETFPGIKPHPYGGPFDTIPAYAVFETGLKKIRDYDALIGQVLIDGVGLENQFLLLQEQNPEIYSNKVLGLPEYS
jgi:hypothetical protein